ncbi:flagellar hook-associated protein FlgK [Pseudomonas sp. TTU2014-080ASC]|uniref:flagellar hook-associated protein FlgK n=1 Tax=Pseudomonas sp. TTU2014-080ASC TaxID=1729724 RepID=UPI000718937F|nr:flagellar hook-associated protein FlgK [Pseudomonas sp. TTU2014-080ASC]KRW62251.1 flagellar biosynthesis protein FlgK [Pseudomonas sp. TTU2014-080ASC]
MADLLQIGLSGLSANKTSLAVTGHNITNVNTPGFSRQSTIQSTQTPQFSGAGFIGTGTTLADVRRIYNEFLTNQVRSSTALNSDAQSYLSQISQLDSLLAGTTTGITPGMQKLFAALQTAAEDPSDLPARQLVLSEAEGLAKRFNTVYDRLNEQNAFVNKQMSAISDQVNQLATSIAKLNDAIATAAASGSAPNDLLDSREEAIRQLSTFVGVSVVAQDDNSYNVFVGSGQPLVVGNKAARLEVVPGTKDPMRNEVQFVSGNSRQTITSMVTGGEMGGLIRYREDVLDNTLNSIGRLALSVTDQMNRQLGQGLDLNGEFGRGLFRDINDPELTKLRSLAQVGNYDGDANLNVLITDTNLLTTSDYEVTFTSASEFTVRRLDDGKDFGPFDVGSVPPAEFDGLSININAGSVVDGDKFRLIPTRNAAQGIRADMKQPEELAFASPLKSEVSPANVGTGTISQPTLKTQIDIYDPDAKTWVEDSLRQQPPVRIVMGPEPTVAGGLQTFDVYDTAGNILYSNSITPGQNNTIEITIPPEVGPPYLEEFTYTVDIGGRPKAGDSFSVSFNTNGVSDNRNALQLIDLQKRPVIGVNPLSPETTGASFNDAYGDLVERVGTLTSQARVDGEANTAILKQATDNRDSVSAVNLDEEAANLIKFEQYYQASAQIIQVARSLFDTLINSF